MTRYRLDPDTSQVWIEGSSSLHPIRANATGLSGWVEFEIGDDGARGDRGLRGQVRVALDLLRSGNPLVDRETRRRIDIARFPEILGTAVSSERLSEDTFRLAGDIDFRGIERRVSGDIRISVPGADTARSTRDRSPIQEGDHRITLEGTQRFDVRDWDLSLPRLGLLKVHPDIEVRVHLEATPESSRS